jgi:hypothetical protein
MAQIPLQLPVASVIGRDGQAANARLINGYAELIERDGKAGHAVYGAPGLTRWDQGSYIGACRGLIELDANNLVAILGNQVVKFDTGGSPTLIGTITGTGPVIVALDREIPKSIAAVTSEGLYYLITGGDTVTRQTLADLPAPQSVAYLAGHYLFSIEDARVFCSAIDDGTSVNAAAFDTANLNPDNNVRAYAYNGYLYVFGKKSCEIWVPDTALAEYPFPFSNTRQTITMGLMAAHTIAEMDDGLVWVDHEGAVRYGVPGGAQRISTHTVERAVAALTPSEQASMIGSVANFHGHKAYILRSTKWCWWWDLRAPGGPQWVERKTFGSDTWQATHGVSFNGKTIFGNDADGKLYWLNPEDPTDDGLTLEMELWCGVSHAFPAHMIVDALKVDVIGGVGLQTGADDDVNPVLMIDYSDNGGKTFEGERFESLGSTGSYGITIETYRWGLVREKGRIWRFRSNVNALKGVIQAQLKARAIRG